ncbi:MAG: GDYXXLXY domain-containing protein [Candidatus Hydrogenedentes bacterium]|nr:GDYXXLXY domain-containing protein [Candidatus Hydrogenedentota bacterium]
MKKPLSLVLFAALVVAQLCVPAAMIIGREMTLRQGKAFRFHTAPVDPYDAFRGRFVALRLEPDNGFLPEGEHIERSQKLYATLGEDEQGFAKIAGLSLTKPEVEHYLPVRGYPDAANGGVRVLWPIDRYYLDEALAPEAEQLYRRGSSPAERTAYVSVRVHKGHAVLDGLPVFACSFTLVGWQERGLAPIVRNVYTRCRQTVNALPEGTGETGMRRNMRRACVAILLGACGAMTGVATADPGDVVFVDRANTSGVENGLSWSTAYTTIHAGIEAARRNFGGEVWVAEGVYAEERSNGTLRLRPLVDVYGGFAGTETARNQRDWQANVTVIDGATADAGEPAENVVTGADDARLDGFTVRGGRGSHGAGMLNIENSPLVANCTFTDNLASEFGGAVINVDGALAQFIDCLFTANSAEESGGAVANTNASSVFEGCTFSENTAAAAGGAIFNTPGSDALVSECVFRGNTATNGGAIFTDEASPLVERSRFFDNVADEFGGAVFNNNMADAMIINSVFARNIAENGRGGAIANQESGLFLLNCTLSLNDAGTAGGAVFSNGQQLLVINSILWENTPTEFSMIASDLHVEYSNVDRGGVDGEGNISFDPRFEDPETDDFNLQPQSRSINAGTIDPAPAEDVDGVARPQGEGVDMGAYEATDIGEPEPIPPLGCLLFGTLNPGGWPTPPAHGDAVVLTALATLLGATGWLLRHRNVRSWSGNQHPSDL